MLVISTISTVEIGFVSCKSQECAASNARYDFIMINVCFADFYFCIWFPRVDAFIHFV